MLRKYKNSEFAIFHIRKEPTEIEAIKIIRQYIIQTEKINDDTILAEYFNTAEEFLEAEPLNAPATYQDSEKAAKIAEYKAVTLNNNNFNDKWSNKTLGELFEANDREFIERAKKEMKNEYIKERIIFLDKELNGKWTS